MEKHNDHSIDIERYLDGDMTADESRAFRNLLNSNPDLTRELDRHKALRLAIKKYGEQQTFKASLEAIHQSMDADVELEAATPVVELQPTEVKSKGKVVSIGKMYRTVAMAACITLLLSFGGMYFFQNHQIDEVKSDIQQLAGEINAPLTALVAATTDTAGTSATEETTDEANFFGATAFAVSQDGYLLTSAHITENATGIYVHVGPDSIPPYKADVVKIDKKLDAALLRINHPDFQNLNRLVYPFKTSNGRIGEEVFTLGYPDQELVYGTGSISALHGSRDTIDYMVSVPLNPGNSGSPLLNERGEIVGMTTERNNRKDAASYATKSQYLIAFMEDYIAENAELEEATFKVPSRNTLRGKRRPDQLERLEPFVFKVTVKKKKEKR